MILNEDFFNDIEIKDDDLTIEEPNLTHKEYNVKTSRELIEHKISESKMVLMIHINLDEFYGQFNIWHRIERIMKRLKYMFDVYNINISEPFLMRKDISFKILEDKEFPVDYTLIQHEGCNLYFPEDKLREYGPDEYIKRYKLELFAFLDKKIPVFKTAWSAYNFLIRLDKCIWKDFTDYFEHECFRWCDFYNIGNVYNDNGIITTYYTDNSYLTDHGIDIYKNIKKIVPKKLAKLLLNLILSKFKDKDIRTYELEDTIKTMNQ